MSNIMNMELVQVTPTPNAETAGFILKLQNKSEKILETAFGTKVTQSSLTYYMKVNELPAGLKLAPIPGKPGSKKPAVKFTADLDIDCFNVKERSDYEFEGDDGNIITPVTKWLSLK